METVPANKKYRDSVTCRYCHAEKLHWQLIEDGRRRMFEPDGSKHNCQLRIKPKNNMSSKELPTISECTPIIPDDAPFLPQIGFYSKMVSSLKKSGKDILAELTPEDADMMHMAIGIAGEAGEILDCIKKAIIYRKPLDKKHLMEEMGDLEFFSEGLRQTVGLTREEILEHNQKKLGVRYNRGTYTNEQAQVRKDKI